VVWITWESGWPREKLYGTSQIKKSPFKAEGELLRAKTLHLIVNNNNNNNNSSSSSSSYTWNITHNTESTAV